MTYTNIYILLKHTNMGRNMIVVLALIVKDTLKMIQ